MANRWEKFTDKELQALEECLATAVGFREIVADVLFNRSVDTRSSRLFREVSDEMTRRLRGGRMKPNHAMPGNTLA
jgi:hypothetical protein